MSTPSDGPITVTLVTDDPETSSSIMRHALASWPDDDYRMHVTDEMVFTPFMFESRLNRTDTQITWVRLADQSGHRICTIAVVSSTHDRPSVERHELMGAGRLLVVRVETGSDLATIGLAIGKALEMTGEGPS